MRRAVLAIIAALAASYANAITATKEYVDRATNSTLIAAKAYTDAHSGGGGTNAVQGAARPLPRYLHALTFDSSYANDAAWYYDMADVGGACSVVRAENTFSRNFDFPYDERSEFVVRMTAGPDRFASVGVSNAGTNLTEDAVASGKWSRYYKCLPGLTVDGVNERGVVAEINVIPTNGAERTAWPGHGINALGAVRWVLDHATDAGMAASNLAAKVYIPDALIRKGYSAHFMIADENSTWVVEDGAAHPVGGVIPNAPPAVMTNFRLFSDDPYGTGYERYDLLASGGNITSAWFRAAYRRPFARPTEFAAPGVGTHTATNALLAWAEANIPQGAPESLTRNGKSWQTIHTSVYDLSNRVLRVAVQETDDWYAFAVPSAGGVDEEAVLSIVGPMIEGATNATLAAAKAYTDAHAGTGGLSTNAVLALIEDAVGGTNAVRAAVAHTAVGPTWMRPNAWRLTASPTRDVAEIAAIYYSTNNYRMYSNEVARVVTTRSAQLHGERLDRYAIDPLVVTNFAAVTPGCSVDQLGYVTAEADGQYRVAGTDATGETRYCDIWFSAGIRDTVLNTIYVGDLAPHLAAANDAAKAVLENAALVGTYTVAGKTCNQYSTISLPWAKSGAHGYYNPWAVSGHILMTAGHLGYMGDSGPITYGSTTLDRGHAYWLKDWALEHGFTPAEVNAVSMIGDIELIVCTGGPIPAADLPTVISPEKFAARFPGGLNGAVVWSANQHHADMVPRVVIDSHGHTFAGDDRWAGYSARADLAAILAAMGQQHIFHGGDSGHVVFLRDDGYDIPLTQYCYASGGPDLVAAYPMLKAFVESFGDTLKEVE